MAITKLLRIKEAAGKKKDRHMKNNIFYICHPDKTENGLWLSGNAGITPEEVYKSFKKNKQYWCKPNGSQAFHYILSFKPGEVDEELALKVAEEFCENLLGEDFFHVIAVHNDQHHIHAHMTFDSVSRTDGHKFHSPKGDWKKRIQPLTDQLCQAHGLSTLEYDPEKQKGKPHHEWEAEQFKKIGKEKSGSLTKHEIMQLDIDEAVANSSTYEEFLSYVEHELSYEIRDAENLLLKMPETKKAISTSRLGENYTKDKIMERLSEKERFGEPPAKISDDSRLKKIHRNRLMVVQTIRLKIQSSGGKWKMSESQKAFYRRWNFTYLSHKPKRGQQAWKYKQDLMQLDKLTRLLCYSIDHDIGNTESMLLQKKLLSGQKKELQKSLAEQRNVLSEDPTLLAVQELLFIEKEEKRFPPGSRPDLTDRQDYLKKVIEASQPMDDAKKRYQDITNSCGKLKADIKEVNNKLNKMEALKKELEISLTSEYLVSLENKFEKQQEQKKYSLSDEQKDRKGKEMVIE